jgi:hypothetical protein
MHRILRILFVVLAALLVVYIALFENYMRLLDQFDFQSKLVWVLAAGALFLLLAAWRFPVRWNFLIFLLFFCVLCVEAVLQALCWSGVLPGITAKNKAPFGRVYWTAEGRGNSIRNRYGWYYPKFNESAPFRIAYIGDSQTEGVESPPDRNQAADLDILIKKEHPDMAVLGMGTHGSCAAFHLDVLEYAWRHFQPREAIVEIYLGASIAEMLPEFHLVPPSGYIYYSLDSGNHLVLNPLSAGVRHRFDQTMEICHQSLLVNAPIILNTHCMILQTFDSLRSAIRRRRQQGLLAARIGGLGQNEDAEYAQIGFDPVPFAVHRSAQAQLAINILEAELRRCKEICDSHGMTFRLVIIPVFPRPFYQTQHGTNWTLHIGDYDYLAPEQDLMDFAHTNGIPVAPIGHAFKEKGLSAEEIHSLYLTDGVGHLSIKGHHQVAEIVCQRFYSNHPGGSE